MRCFGRGGAGILERTAGAGKVDEVLWFFLSRKNFFLKKEAKTSYPFAFVMTDRIARGPQLGEIS
jgi:hypothetical protein